jgi:hypothetical protein
VSGCARGTDCPEYLWFIGDLHPYLAIAIGLRSRGHEPVIAISEVYRQKILHRSSVGSTTRQRDSVP